MTKRILAYFVVTFAVITCLCAPVAAQVAQINHKRVSSGVSCSTLALRWLKEHQNEDGSWGSNPTNRPALTGLAILAYAFHAETPISKEFGMTVEKGLRRLLYDVAASKTNGTLGGIENEYISTEAIVTYALAEAYGMTQMLILNEPTTNMVCRTIALRVKSPIWTSYAVDAARSAVEVSDIDKQRVVESCLASVKGTDLLSHATAMTSIQLLPAWREDVRYAKEIETVMKLAKCNWHGHHETLPMLTWFVTTEALDKEQGSAWKKWLDEFIPPLVNNMQKDGHWCVPVSPDGSGKKERAMWGEADSEIYATCLVPIMLAIRFPNMPPPESVP